MIVATPAGQVELAERGASTTVVAGNAPAPPSLMSVSSHGESDLLVRTPGNAAEARNRRVEVIVR